MPSADFSWFTAASPQRLLLYAHTPPLLEAPMRSPRVSSHSFPPSTCRIYATEFRIAIGLRLGVQPYPSAAPDAISVRQARGLPRASFRPHLTMVPLLSAMCFPLSGCTRDFHPLECAHAWRTRQKALRRSSGGGPFRLAHEQVRWLSW